MIVLDKTYKRTATDKSTWTALRIDGDRTSLLNLRTGDVAHVPTASQVIDLGPFEPAADADPRLLTGDARRDAVRAQDEITNP